MILQILARVHDAALDSARSKITLEFVKQMRFLMLIGATISLFFGHSVFSQGVQIEKAPGSAETPAPPTDTSKSTPSPTPTAAEALYDYIQQYHIEVAKDQVGPRYVWTDRVFIEIGDGPPPEPLASLLSPAPGNRGEFVLWVQNTFQAQMKTWHPAKKNPHPLKQGTDEIVSDTGDAHCFVNPVYTSYVLARYPKANVLIKGPSDPVLFTVDGQLRAVVSPWTKLPDGTPLL
jgi:hypothetical protein